MSGLRDPALPGLDVALDQGRFHDFLRLALPECRNGFDLEELRTDSVRYEPRKRCVVLYSARFRNRKTGRSARQMLSAVLLPETEVSPPPPSSLLARAQASGAHPISTPCVRLTGTGLTLYPYPFDVSLPALLDACNPAKLRQAFHAVWRSRGVRPRRVRVERLGYTPGARAALAYEVLAESRQTGVPEVRRLVGKLDAQRGSSDLFAQGWALWRAGGSRLELVPPVGYLASLDVYLQERIDGTRLVDHAATGEFPKWVRQTARSAAVLHDLDLPLCSRRTAAKEARAVQRRGRLLAAIRPAIASRVQRLCERIAAELERRAVITGPIHADLHPTNVLISGGRVTLIDLDNASLGDRLLDVGRFLSALRTSSIRLHGHAHGLAAAGESFLETYLSRTGEDESRARLFEAACLITSAGTGFRLQREGWEASADALVEEAESVLRRSLRGPSVQPRVVTEEGEGGRPDRCAFALDPVYMRAALQAPVRRLFRADLTDCRVHPRRQTAKAQRIRYRLAGRRKGARWSASVEGIVGGRRSGRSAARRLSAVESALAGVGDAPVLPRPLASLPEIGLRVVEVAGGKPIARHLATPEGAAVAERLARALATLHLAEVELDRTHALEDELAALQRLVGRSLADRPGLREWARRELARIEGRLGSVPQRVAPVMRRLRPEHVLLVDGRIAFAQVDDIVLSHPFLDAADFLARLWLPGLSNDHLPPAVLAAELFRRTYLAGVRGEDEDLRLFEAASLLRLSCSGSNRRLGGAALKRVLSTVRSFLDTGAPEPSTGSAAR